MASTFSLQGRLGLDSRDFVKGARQAETAIGGVADDLDDLPKQAGDAGSRSGGLLSSNLAKGFAMAGGAAALAAGFKSTITAASDLAESTNAVGVAFGDAGDAVLAFGEDAADSYGMSKTAFNEAAVGFSSFAQDIAGSGGDVAGTLDELMTRATDMASVFNVEVPDAANAMRSALSGEAEPMKQFGVVMSEAKVQAYALRTGIIKQGEAMNDAQKMTARYGFIMEETAKVQGDWAKTSDGFAGSMKKAQAKLEDLKAQIGEELIPTVTTLVAGFVDLLDAWNALEKVGPVKFVIELTGEDSAIGFLDRFGKFASGIPGLTTGLGKAKDAFDDFNGVTRVSQEEFDRATSAIAGHDKALASMERGAGGALRAVEDAATGVEDLGDEADATADALDAVTAEFEAMKDSLSDRSAFLGVEDAFDSVAEKGLEAWDAAATGAANADQLARDYEQTIIDLKNDVIDYATEVGDIPPDVVTEINALIDEGNFAEAERRMAELERNRKAHLTVRITQEGQVILPGGARVMDTGGRLGPGQSAWVAEKRPELVNGMMVHTPAYITGPADVTGGAATAALFGRSSAPSGFANGSAGVTNIITVHSLDAQNAGRIIQDSLNQFYASGGQRG